MPGIADPGEQLVRACVEAGCHVEVVPGPERGARRTRAVGPAASRFRFDGFLPAQGRRREPSVCRRSPTSDSTMVLFESPHRVAATLADLLAACGPDRSVAVARELTKRYEQVVRGTLADVSSDSTTGERTGRARDRRRSGADAPSEVDNETVDEGRRRAGARSPSDERAMPPPRRSRDELGVSKRRAYDAGCRGDARRRDGQASTRLSSLAQPLQTCFSRSVPQVVGTPADRALRFDLQEHQPAFLDMDVEEVAFADAEDLAKFGRVRRPGPTGRCGEQCRPISRCSPRPVPIRSPRSSGCTGVDRWGRPEHRFWKSAARALIARSRTVSNTPPGRMGADASAPTFYVTTPIYYVNDVPHIGHAYTTVAGRRAHPVAAPVRRRRRVPHRHRRARPEDPAGRRGAAASRPRSWSTRPRSAFRDAWDLLDITYDDFIRTTEPRHYEAVQEFLQVVYDAGDIELGTYEGLYCVSCEAYYTEDELVDGMLPDPRQAGRARHRGELLLQAVALRGAPARPLRRASRGGAARLPAATRCSGFIRQGLQRLLDEPDVDHVGDPAAVGPEARHRTCGSTRCSTTAPRSATATTRAVRPYWPVDYHLVGKDILRFHAVYWPAMLMAAGLAPPKCVFAHGWLLVGGEKMSKTRAQPDRARRPRRRLRCRRVPLPLPARPALRSRRRLQLRGDGARATTPTSRTTSATSRTACSTWR